MSAFKDLFDISYKYWYKPLGLLISIVLALLCERILLYFIPSNEIINLIIFLITILVLIIIWHFSRRLPRTKKGKVGFVVSFHCPEEDERKLIKEDFIRTLHELIKKGSVGSSFHFIEIPERISEKIINFEDANELRIKCKAHFILYGRVRVRQIKGKTHHVMTMDGAVAHKPIPKEISSKIAREFTELLPQNVKFEKEDDILSFDFTSDWTNCVAKYIIGIASAQSLDFNYSIQLFQDVQSRLNEIQSDFPIFSILKKRVPLRLAEIYEVQAGYNYDLWIKNKNNEYINKMGGLLGKIDEELRDRYRYLIFFSIYQFLNNRNVEGAIQSLKKCRKLESSIWHLNLAFLYAYSDNLRDALRQYKIARTYPVEIKVMNQIEDFICYILEIEPDKYQLLYCLGFFNYQIKGDMVQAKKDLNRFLKERLPDRHLFEKDLAERWLTEITESEGQTA